MLPANGWRPRDYQMPLWSALEQGCKRAIAIWHRRAGKDEVILHRTACAIFERIGSYVHMLPLANQARRAIWDAVNPHTGKRRIDEAFPVELRETTRDQDMFIRFKNGSTWQVAGSDNFGALIGSSLAGIVFSEFALADPGAWDYLRPILVENNGWAFFITTPRGRNHASRLYEFAISIAGRADGWFGQKLTVDDTHALSAAQLDAERRELASVRGDKEAEAIIAQEYFCDFDAAIPGAYYGEHMANAEKEGRICSVPYDPRFPVDTSWDLGIGDTNPIVFWQSSGPGRVHAIDFYEASGAGLDHYAKVLACRPYAYRRHYLPHDVEVSELGTGTTRLETLRGLGIKATVLATGRGAIDERINASRMLLPRVWFNTDPLPLPAIGSARAESPEQARNRMTRLLDALRQYRREWDEKRNVFKERPAHDWASHPADAFGYGAQGLKIEYPSGAGTAPRQRQAVTDYQEI
jgi:phage terminase large subunit